MKVMTTKKTIVKGKFTYKLTGIDDTVTHVHINNHKSNKQSVIVPVEAIWELLQSNTPVENGLVEILHSTNPYHQVGDLCKVWHVDKINRTVRCPDDSCGSVTYFWDDVVVSYE